MERHVAAEFISFKMPLKKFLSSPNKIQFTSIAPGLQQKTSTCYLQTLVNKAKPLCTAPKAAAKASAHPEPHALLFLYCA